RAFRKVPPWKVGRSDGAGSEPRPGQPFLDSDQLTREGETPMLANVRIKDVERIVVDVPFTPRCQEWNAREIGQWRIVEVIRVTTDAPGLVGYGETLPHYTWGRVSDEAIARVRGGNPAAYLGDDSLGAGLQMALYDLVGKALGVPVYRLFNL